MSDEDAAMTPREEDVGGEELREESTKMRRFNGCRTALVVIGVLVAAMGTAMLAGGYDAMFTQVLKSQMEIREGSESYEVWRKTPFPLILKIYLFNITNAQEFVNGSKPRLQECGPYVWREYHEKQNITFNSNATVTYFQQRWWEWDEERSGNNSRQDVIITLNTVPVAAAWSLRDNAFLLKFLDELFETQKEPIIVTTTADKLLFSGYEDPVLTYMVEHPIFSAGKPIADKFAWFYKRNLSLSYDGLYNMKTGQDSLQNLGKIDWWNQTRRTPFYESPCNAVTGSAGELFPPGLQKDNITLYSSDLCMSLTLPFAEEVTAGSGLSGYRYAATNTTFANGTVVPGRECYCVNGICAPTGLLNVESCRNGAPAFVSFPHFLHADPYLLGLVDGLHPDKDRHSFFMDVIPELGTPMNVAARVQINLHVTPYRDNGPFHMHRVRLLENLPDVYLPMLWFEELAEMPPSMAPPLKTVLFLMTSVVMGVVWAVLVGLGMVLVAAVVLDWWIRARRSHDPLLDPLM